MSKFDALEAFPDKDSDLPNCSVRTVYDGYGVLAAQNAEDLHQLFLHVALSPSPRGGFASVCFDAQGARSLASHLLMLADAAEKGLAADGGAP